MTTSVRATPRAIVLSVLTLAVGCSGSDETNIESPSIDAGQGAGSDVSVDRPRSEGEPEAGDDKALGAPERDAGVDALGSTSDDGADVEAKAPGDDASAGDVDTSSADADASGADVDASVANADASAADVDDAFADTAPTDTTNGDDAQLDHMSSDGAPDSAADATGVADAPHDVTPDAPPAPGWYFDTTLEKWAVYNYSVPSDLWTHMTAAWDGTEGNPAAGSAKLTIPFSGNNDNSNFALLFAVKLNLANKVVHANVFLDSGQGVIAYLYLQTGATFAYADSGPFTLQAGQWVTLTMHASSPEGVVAAQYDPSQVAAIGISVRTVASGTTSAAVVHIDSVTYQ